MPVKVLIADDDKDFLDVASYGLRRAGFDVVSADSGREILQLCLEDLPDIVLLDVALQDVSGFEICRRIRGESAVPVVFLSGQRDEADTLRGFAAGADDFLTKPIGIRELVMRLRALYQRAHSQRPDLAPRHVRLGELEIDADFFTVTLEGRPLRLTRREFQLLFYLAVNAGQVVTSSRLVELAWGTESEGDPSLLKTHFSHIRQKLRQASALPITIVSIPGVGYRLALPADLPLREAVTS